MKRLFSGLALLLLTPGLVLAQEAVITGTVTDAETGNPLPGANVVIEELSIGAAADVDGNYRIDIPEEALGQQVTLTAQFVGYEPQSRQITLSGGTSTQDFTLEAGLLDLNEVVVTGVATGTATRELGFSVVTVDDEALEAVPAVGPGAALQGKVAGITVVSGSGAPGSAPDIRLRGSTSITGESSPLIIVDGVITSGSLRDINMQNVESIEVLKGAAAAALYGSLAGNGVIQIRTKDGSAVTEPRVTYRVEFGASDIANEYPLATRHPWTLDSLRLVHPSSPRDTMVFVNPTAQDFNSVPEGSRVVFWHGRAIQDIDDAGRFDNPFPVLYNNVENVFTGQPFLTNYVSLAGGATDYNYFASFENFRQGGVMAPVEPYTRSSFRLNADYRPTDRFSVNFNGYYVTSQAPRIQEQGQGDNYFYSVLTAAPFIDMTEKTEEGLYSNDPTGYDIQSSNWQNPLYVAQQRERSYNRDRIIAGLSASYELTDWLIFNGQYSLDKAFIERTTFYPAGFQTPIPNSNINNGFDYRRSAEESTEIARLWAEYSQEFDNFSLQAIANYQYEDRHYEYHEGSGSNYPVGGIRDIGSLDPATIDIDSYQETVRAEDFYFNLRTGWDDKLYLDGLIRRDGSSLFGAEERWQTYYRASIAYILSEDVDIPGVQRLKLRTLYGTSGNRPPFEAQYETFNATSTGISPDILGNDEIKPATAAEWASGIDLYFLNRFSFTANYAMTHVTDAYLLVPLSSAAGYTNQWQNVGEIENTALEFALRGRVLDAEDFAWDASVTFSHITQVITSLSGVPPFTRELDLTGSDPALPLFRVEPGVPYGAMYGNKVATSLDQLTVDENGNVLNAGIDTNGDGRLTVADYEINGHGYVVPKGTHGTEDEQVVYIVDENGQKAIVQIGNTQPDFSMGFVNTFNWKGFTLYTLFDWVNGGDVYNYTKQLLYFNYRHKDQQEFAEQGYHVAYSGSNSSIYNGASASSYFVEDASFVKLRQVALSYTFNEDVLGALGRYIDGIKISAIGRNLLTFTDYSGWDPEVALSLNSTNFRLDEFAYPNFRTYTGSIQLRF